VWFFRRRASTLKLTAYENLWHQDISTACAGALKRRIHESSRGLAWQIVRRNWLKLLGGMQRRIELAKGLLHHPGVLLLDEPTTASIPGSARFWQYLQMLRDEEHVSVLVTTALDGRG